MTPQTIKLPEGHVWVEVRSDATWVGFECKCGATFTHDLDGGTTSFDEGDGSCGADEEEEATGVDTSTKNITRVLREYLEHLDMTVRGDGPENEANYRMVSALADALDRQAAAEREELNKCSNGCVCTPMEKLVAGTGPSWEERVALAQAVLNDTLRGKDVTRDLTSVALRAAVPELATSRRSFDTILHRHS